MIKQTLKLIFLVLIFFPLTSFISPKSYATTLFSDEFNGTGELSEYDNNWHCLTNFSNNNGTPTCDGFKGGFQVITDHVMTSGFDPGYVYTGFQATDNVCVSVTFNWSEGGEWTAILLHADSDMANNKFYIEKPGRIPGVTWILDGAGVQEITGEVPLDSNISHIMKACVSGDIIQGYLDNNLLFTEHDPINANKGTYVGFASQYPTYFLDNFTVESFSNLNDLPVPSLKQTSSPWGSEIYDGANNWFAQDPTISRWGCALTSATMILQYNGITKLPDGTQLTPGSLNSWLKNNHGFDDGINNGYIIPAAIGRLSKKAISINNITSFDALETKITHGYNSSILTEDLANNQADVLGVNNDSHFVVAKGVNGATFDINDPYFSRNSLTDGYNNVFSSITQYKPSHTDISYIFISTTPNVTVELKDSNGVTQGDSFLQNPINDPISNLPSGQASRIVAFAKPPTDNYSLIISSSTDQYYKSNVYLFDNNGEEKVITDQGTVGSGSSDASSITFNKDSATTSSSIKEVTFQNATDDVNELQSLNRIKGGGGLLADLKNAQKAQLSQDVSTAQVKLNQFISHITQQRGKGVSEDAYQILSYDANYLLSSL